MRCQRYKYLLSFGWHNPKRSKFFYVNKWEQNNFKNSEFYESTNI